MIPAHLQFTHLAGKRVHVGITGSIAAYKALDICRSLISSDLCLGVTLSDAARQFVTPLSFEALGADPVYTNMFEERHRLYGHLEPGQNAEALLIAPCTANTLAKLAAGLADDMLSCQALAFSGATVLAPAMNPNLWNALPTKENVNRLRSRQIQIVEPMEGQVACGDLGKGRLAPLEEIVFHLFKALSKQDLQGKSILITLGPTREYWDALRFWSNPSSGKMGAALAVACWMRGAEVHCVSGPVDVWLPGDIAVHQVQTAQQMYETSLGLWPKCDIGCLSAAVCDFRPLSYGKEKFKKDSIKGQDLNIHFEFNPDILRSLGQQKTSNQKLVGFAAETDGQNLMNLARSKLQSKNLDLIAANCLSGPVSALGSASNRVVLLDRKQKSEDLPLMSKADVAWRIWDWIQQI